jgi:cytoskeletal protein CcmA (bactofilin family)
MKEVVMSFFGGRRQVEPSSPQPTVEKPQLPKPSVPPAPVGFETVLGANSTLEGVLRSNANVRLDGAFTGTLEITGNVLVGETAKINADINAKNISIAGAVRGNVSGKKVQLLRTGRIWGDIRATALTTEEGAFIDGKITMVGHETLSIAEPEIAPEVESAPLSIVSAEADAAAESESASKNEVIENEKIDENHSVTDAEADDSDATQPDGNQPG